MRSRNAAAYLASVLTGAQPPARMLLARPSPTLTAMALPLMALGSSTTLAHLPGNIFMASNAAVAVFQATSSGLATSWAEVVRTPATTQMSAITERTSVFIGLLFRVRFPL